MPKLVVKTGPEAGRRVELSGDVVIGRQDADLALQDPEVSRRHALLRRSGDSVVIEDLQSTNGTFVNRERIRKPVKVHPGDLVMVGGTTLEIEQDWRAEETFVSLPLSPDQIRPVDARSFGDPVVEDEDEIPTQPLPRPMGQSTLRPARRHRTWFAVGVLGLALLVGAITYAALGDRPVESDFVASANDACTAVQRSEGRVDLGRHPTRRELEGARNIRLKALEAIRALKPPKQDAALVGSFLSAFGETNASILRLEAAMGSAKRKVTTARRGLREDVRNERELAAKAGFAGCGGLAIR